jgi:hypothetical protein
VRCDVVQLPTDTEDLIGIRDLLRPNFSEVSELH